ncbi:NUDIX domain-containing protein [Streptomyces sp. ME18-1-4]|uniref:NUDIX domain-containing protein n=1 Tax=Streptomyces sp. ME18-1-4 TaxID=3028685 RepID=UPI0029AA5CFF|nr:NUDIX domain-containing protein [Streptomyces sp. ME18-1-4]MDX3248103.1 NUDIX domain-containing protein [Streptomyces sp. ME18-1-4]
MQELTLRVRVAAYVLRRRAGRPVELLVFDHDTDLPPGTHVPAGGVAPGEPLEEAVLREVAEECGLTRVRVLRPIAEEHTRTRFAASPATPPSSNWQWTTTQMSRMCGTTV